MIPSSDSRKRFIYGIALQAALLVHQPADAAAEWEQAGWGGGGYFRAAAWHPTQDGVIYMGGDCAGMYRTEDHGKPWRLINTGLLSYAVYSIAVDPSNPQTVPQPHRPQQPRNTHLKAVAAAPRRSVRPPPSAALPEAGGSDWTSSGKKPAAGKVLKHRHEHPNRLAFPLPEYEAPIHHAGNTVCHLFSFIVFRSHRSLQYAIEPQP